MRLLPWDPDIQTIISRIDSKGLDLQPNFQRGEVWSRAKKQRLIDSVLRDWHVPPIHVIEYAATKQQEVLDGQQRLAAIRDFAAGAFPVDGQIEPSDAAILRLNGLKYGELPDDARRQFEQFTLRVYRIVDFKTTEPAELFFRLNQPTNLTGAEQRNAFFGPVREQIKELVDRLPSYGLGKAVLGFSNSRMAYDDVLCRVALTIERGSIAIKINANDLVELYRSDSPISNQTVSQLHQALDVFGQAAAKAKQRPRLNKATVYSWLVFIVRGLSVGPTTVMNREGLAKFMERFESERVCGTLGEPQADKPPVRLSQERLFAIYDDRSTSRVADVSSIVLRDIVIWIAFAQFLPPKALDGSTGLVIDSLEAALNSSQNVEDDGLARAAIELGWGDLR